MAGRIVCTRCKANNFPGQARCWQCGHSLPPPEDTAVPPRAQAAQPTPSAASWATTAADRRPTRTWLWLIAGVLVIGALTVGAAVGLRARRQQATPDDLRAQIEALERQIGNTNRQSPTAVSDPSVLDPDSVGAQARRELERLQKEHSLPPPADSQGNVHLRNGSTLTAEEYRKYQSTVSGGR